jgi:hypothetical protein
VAQRLEHLGLLVADVLGLERRLHGHQGQHLELVVLEDVADGPGGLVEVAPVLDPQRLGHRHLDVVDEVVVPDRLEDPVGEAEGDDVLDALLAQVVVDPEHVPLREHGRDQLLELAGGGQVVAEGLLHHHPRVAAVPAAAAQPGLADPPDGVGEQLGDERQVEEPVAVGAVLAVEAVEQVADAAVVSGSDGPGM